MKKSFTIQQKEIQEVKAISSKLQNQMTLMEEQLNNTKQDSVPRA